MGWRHHDSSVQQTGQVIEDNPRCCAMMEIMLASQPCLPIDGVRTATRRRDGELFFFQARRRKSPEGAKARSVSVRLWNRHLTYGLFLRDVAKARWREVRLLSCSAGTSRMDMFSCFVVHQ